ncbi:hypothetical protein COU76_00355, partial [Candidatus Peregrinibacteria bacterium CG10_big_fil_rev_8_21_14_0_10_49_10]
MHTYRASAGSSPLGRETRLCHVHPQGQSSQESNFDTLGHHMKQGAASFMEGIYSRFRDVIEKDKQTDANMRSEQMWIQAFEDPSLLDEPTVTLDQRKTLRPKDLLRSLSPGERKRELVRFMRSMVPGAIRDEYAFSFKDDAFRQKVFDTFTLHNARLDMYMDRARSGEPIEIDDPDRQTMLFVQKLLIGEDVENERGTRTEERDIALTNARNIATATLLERYFGSAESLGIAVADYEEAMQCIGTDVPTDITTNATAFANALSAVRKPKSEGIGRFTGALKLGVLKTTDLKDRLLPHINARQEEENERIRQSRKERDVFKKGVETEKEKQLQSFMENWDNLGGKEKFVAIAIGVYAAYRMFTSESKFWQSIPYVLAGTYFYKKLVRGEDDAFGSMGDTAQEFFGTVSEKFSEGLKMVGLSTKQDRDSLSVMQQWLTQEQIRDPVASTFAALSEVSFGQISKSLTIDPRGGAAFDLKAGRTKIEIQIIAGKRGYNTKEIFKLIEKRNGYVGDALTHVMYMLGREGNLNTARTLEAYTKTNHITDHTTLPKRYRNMYFKIVSAGQDRAEGDLAQKSFMDVIQGLQKKQPEAAPEATLDDADVLSGDFDTPLDVPTRELEKAFLTEAENTQLGLTSRTEVTQDDGLLDVEVQESLFNMEETGLITTDAQTMLLGTFEILRRDEHIPLRDMLMAIERLKYGILVRSLKSNKLPLSAAEIGTLEGAQDVGTFDSILSFTDRLTRGTSGKFGAIENLRNIEALLQPNFMSRLFGRDVQAADANTLSELRESIGVYQRFFASLREKGNINPDLVSEIEAVLGNEGRAFFEQLFYQPEQTGNTRIANMERYFAQRVANSLVLAMLTSHRANGVHSLSTIGETRRITPNEGINLENEWKELFRIIVNADGAIGVRVPAMWEMVDVLDQEIDFDALPTQIATEKEEARREETYKDDLDKSVQIARAWFLLNQQGTDSNVQKQKEELEARIENFGETLKTFLASLTDANRAIHTAPPSTGNPGGGYRLITFLSQTLKLMGKTQSAEELTNLLATKSAGAKLVPLAAGKDPQASQETTPSQSQSTPPTAPQTPQPAGQTQAPSVTPQNTPSAGQAPSVTPQDTSSAGQAPSVTPQNTPSA